MKSHFNCNIRVTFLNQFQRRHKIAISTDKGNGICCSNETILYHSDGNVDICFLLFWPRNISFAIRTYNMLFKILAADNFEAVAINQFVRIQKCTLSTTLVWI